RVCERMAIPRESERGSKASIGAVDRKLAATKPVRLGPVCGVGVPDPRERDSRLVDAVPDPVKRPRGRNVTSSRPAPVRSCPLLSTPTGHGPAVAGARRLSAGVRACPLLTARVRHDETYDGIQPECSFPS